MDVKMTRTVDKYETRDTKHHGVRLWRAWWAEAIHSLRRTIIL